jgi:hypothetical protein
MFLKFLNLWQLNKYETNFLFYLFKNYLIILQTINIIIYLNFINIKKHKKNANTSTDTNTNS